VALGPGKSLSLVTVGGKSFLLAATNDRISLISELAASDLTIEVDPPENNPETMAGFDMAGFHAAASSADGKRRPAGYLRSFRAVLSKRVQRDSKAGAASGRT